MPKNGNKKAESEGISSQQTVVAVRPKMAVTVIRNIARQAVHFTVNRKYYVLEPSGTEGDKITIPTTFDTAQLSKQYANFLVIEVKEE